MDNSFLHRKKLLLVDDEPDLLKMVSDILSDAGFETVLTAATVKEAIITAEKEKPDLMVLDVMLPDGDGFSLMKQQTSWLVLALEQTIIFQSRLCRRSYYCVSMRFCAELIKRTARGFSWMDVRLILAGQRSTRAARLSP